MQLSSLTQHNLGVLTAFNNKISLLVLQSDTNSTILYNHSKKELWSIA